MTRVSSIVIAAFIAVAPATSLLAQPAEQRAPGVTGNDLPPEVVNRLSPEQLVEVLRERERTEQRKVQRVDPEDTAVPIVLFVAVVASIGLVQYFGHRRDGQKQRTLQAMVERGIEIPPELLVKPVRPGSDLRRGLVLIGSGLGIAAFFALLGAPGMPTGLWSIGLIPALIGLGYLVAFYVETRRAGSR